MNCHSKIKTESPKLQILRDSFTTGEPIPWVKVHDLPDYVYFDHSAHVNQGVGCVECHGRVDQMEVVTVVKPLSMGWVLGLPPRSGAEPAPRERSYEHVLDHAGGRLAGRHAEDCASQGKLLHVSPLKVTAKIMSQTEDQKAGLEGQSEIWRSLGEWQNTPEFQALVKKEFSSAEPDRLGPMDRRRFLQLIGASAALASASSCRYEREELLPFAERPEGFVPGDKSLYTSAFERDGVALPLHVTSVDGRPIKIDGNRAHPASGGASDVQAQASILEFYEPRPIPWGFQVERRDAGGSFGF